MTYYQVVPDVAKYDFDFTDWFLSTDTIASISVAATPSGLVELTAKRVTNDVTQTIYISSGLADANTYTLACQATSSSGIKKTLYKTIVLSAEVAGITPVAPASAISGVYSATLAQSGSSAPTITVTNVNGLSAAVVYTRLAEGSYIGTLSGAFPENKTRIVPTLVPYLVANEDKASARRLTDDTFELKVRDYAGNLTDGFSILHIDITVYA